MYELERQIYEVEGALKAQQDLDKVIGTPWNPRIDYKAAEPLRKTGGRQVSYSHSSRTAPPRGRARESYCRYEQGVRFPCDTSIVGMSKGIVLSVRARESYCRYEQGV